MRYKRGELFVVQYKDRQETFREGESYSVRVGAVCLPTNVRAGIASWLAFVAFANGLPFENPVPALRLLSAAPTRHYDRVSDQILVECKGRQETFRVGKSYSVRVRVGVVRLADKVSAGIAAWLAYTAFANDLPFEKSA